MRLFTITILLLLGFALNVSAQSDSALSRMDKIALEIPRSSTNSTEEIAVYLNTKFTKPEEKVRAIYVWLASNIDYDIDNIFAQNRYATSAEIINKTLNERKAICQGYSEVFTALCTQTGIKSFMITGYTKQNGVVDNIPHSWVTAYVNNEWGLYDPTWAAGYIKDQKFSRMLNDDYYDADDFIINHMPFDPIWQMLKNPLTSADFYADKTNGSGALFNYEDSIATYEKQDTITRVQETIRRVEANGIKNSLIYDQLNYLHRELDARKQNIVVFQYNEAVNKSNESVNAFNKYIAYKNKQFTPKKTDALIQQMIDEPEKKLIEAKELLTSIKNPDQNFASTISSLNSMMEDITQKINDEKVFLKKYFNTAKLLRKTLFYQPR